MNLKKAFTLIELLVVIAIIAILAAILFPVFAQAKLAAKKAADISNVKQIDLSLQMYGNDNDDGLPDVACINSQIETYILAAKVMPYVKNFQISKSPASPYNTGSVQHAINDYWLAVAGVGYMKAPDDPCVGLPTSKYGSTWPYQTSDNNYNDIYPATDYQLNADLWGYQGGGCPGGGGTGGYSHPGPNLTSGTRQGSGSQGGLNGIGPSGDMSWTSVAKVIVMIDGPTDNTAMVGDSTSNNQAFWGVNYTGLYNGGSNGGFLDGHAKYVKTAALHPYGLTDNDDHWKCANCSNAQYVSPANTAGELWMFWGTSFAATDQQ
jgi:prepilin-type N-terminal cleavage/methylation domain-containing protein/prepilin-type processing-associated H-X9-DG protein